MGQTVSSVTVVPGQEKEEKFLKISYSGYEKSDYVRFFEAETVRDEETKEINIPFCLTDNTIIQNCATFLSEKNRKKYVISPGKECTSLSFRPGSVLLIDESKVPYSVQQYLLKGTLCKFVNKDFVYTDKDLIRCCGETSLKNCPKIFSNGYSTDHCDPIMSVICEQTPYSISCLKWLKTKREIPLKTYSKICSENLHEFYCSDFVNYTRPDHFSYSDSAILSYCFKHKNNPDCWCVQTPENDRTTTIELALGPKVCWLHECTDKSKDRKYLLFDQDVQRKNCKYIGCDIYVETLRLTNSVAELISDCGGSVIKRTVLGNDLEKEQKTLPPFFSIMFIPLVCIFMFVLFYFVKIYGCNIVNSKTINVYRK